MGRKKKSEIWRTIFNSFHFRSTHKISGMTQYSALNPPLSQKRRTEPVPLCKRLQSHHTLVHNFDLSQHVMISFSRGLRQNETGFSHEFLIFESHGSSPVRNDGWVCRKALKLLFTCREK
ncbi:unnamed protein product [Ectocarpus sp. 6 AP-2014]